MFSSPWDAKEGDESVVTYNEQDLIDGKELTLYTITDPSTRADRTLIYTSIIPNGTKTTFTLTDNGKPINLTLATEIGESKWRDIISDEMSSTGGYVQDVEYRNYKWYKDRNGEWKNCQEGHPKHKKNDDKCSNGKPGSANQDHWYDCDHPGKGEPFAQCTKDNSTNYVTFVLSPGENYTVNVYESGLGDAETDW